MKMLLLAAGAAALLAIDMDAQRGRSRGGGQNATWKFLSKKYDKNKNGKITFKEYKRDKEKFGSMDQDGDGVLTKADFEGGGGRGRGGRGGRRGGDRGGNRGRGGDRRRGGGRNGDQGRGEVAQVGKKAPDFDLPTIKNPKKTIKLSSFADKKPVALIFGSYT
jgi:hypothetical protein